jgi:hypothetical protein
VAEKTPNDKGKSIGSVLKSITIDGLANRLVKAIESSAPDAPLRQVLAAVMSRGGRSGEVLVNMLQRAEDKGMSRQAIIDLVRQASGGASSKELREKQVPTGGKTPAAPADVRDMLEVTVNSLRRGKREEPPAPRPIIMSHNSPVRPIPLSPTAAARPTVPDPIPSRPAPPTATPIPPTPAAAVTPIPPTPPPSPAAAARPTSVKSELPDSTARPAGPKPPEVTPTPKRAGTYAINDQSQSTPAKATPAAATRPTAEPARASGYGAFGQAPVSAATKRADFKRKLDDQFADAGHGPKKPEPPPPPPPRRTIGGEFARGFWEPFGEAGRGASRAMMGMLPPRARRAAKRFMPRPTASAPSGQAGNTGVPPGSSPAAPGGGGRRGGGSGGGPPSMSEMRTQVVTLLASLPVIGSMFRRMQSGGGKGGGGGRFGGGRFGGGSRPAGGSAAAGGGRTAILMAARMAGAFAGAVAGVAAFVVGLAATGAAIRKFAHSVNESNRKLAAYNGQLAGSFAILDVNRVLRDIKTANETAGTGAALADAANADEAAWQPVRAAWANLSNEVSTKILDISAEVASFALVGIDAAEKVLTATEEVRDYIRVLIFGEENAALIKSAVGIADVLKKIAKNTEKNDGMPGVDLMRGILQERRQDAPLKPFTDAAPLWEE